MAGNQIPPPPPMHIRPGQPNQQAMGGHPRTPQQQHPLPQHSIPQHPLAQQQQQQQRPQQPPQAQLTPDQQRHLDAQQHQQKLQREQAQQQQLQARERQQQQTLALQRQQQQEYQRQQSLIQHAQTVQTLSLRDEQPTPDQARERLSTYAVFRFEQAGSFPGSRVSGGGVEHYCSSDDSSDDDDGWHRKKKSKKRTVHSTTKKKKAASLWIDARRIPIPDFKREDVVREIRRLDRETKSLIEKKARLSNEKQRHLELTLDELRRVNASLDVEGNYETNLVQLDDQMPAVVKKHVVEHHDHHHHHRKESKERSRRHGRDGENVKIVSLFGVYQKRPLPSRRREERGRERKSSSHVHETRVRKEMMEPTSITAFFKTSPRHDVDVMALYYQVEAQKDARRLEAQQQQYWLEQQQQQFQQQQLQQQHQFQQQQQQQQKQQQPQQQQQQKAQQQQQQPKQQQNRQDDLQHHGVQILTPQNQQKDKKPDQKDQKGQKGDQPRQGQQYHKQQPNHKDDHHTRHRSPSHHRSPSRHRSPHHRHRSPHRRRRSSSRSSSSSSRHSQIFSARDSVSSTLSFPSRDSKDGDDRRRRAYNQHRRYSEGHFGIVEPGRTFQRRESLPYHHHHPEVVRRIAPVVNVEQIEANAYHAGRADERLETREMIATVAAATAGAGPKAVVSRHRRVGSAPVPQIVYPPPPPGARRLRMVGELEEEEDSEDEGEGWSESGGDDSSEDYGVVMPGERRVYPVRRAPPPGRRSGAVVMEERMGGRVRMVRGADVQQAMRAERVERGEKEVVYVMVGQDEMRERPPGLVRPLKGGQRSFERRSPVVENQGGFAFGERNPFAPRPGLAERR